MANFQDYINVLKSGIIKPRIKIEWLRQDETVESFLEEDILDGSLTINRNNGARRVIDFKIKNSPELLPNIYGIWMNKKIRLSLGVTCADGTDFFIPQGVFILSNPNYVSSPSGSEVTMSATDKFSMLNGENGSGILLDIYQINSGTNIATSIQTILTAFKDPILGNIQATTATTPFQIRKIQGENIGDMMKQLAYSISRNIYYDELGRLVFVDDVDDDKKASLWDYNFQDDKYCYLGSSLEHQFDNVRNVIKVIGENINGAIAVGIAKDTDLSSPTNIYAIGELSEVIINDYIQTNAQALALAEFMLKRKKVLNQAISISSIPMFHLDVDSIITITDESLGLNKSRFLINSITIPLGLFGEMSLSCVKSDEVDYTIGGV